MKHLYFIALTVFILFSTQTTLLAADKSFDDMVFNKMANAQDLKTQSLNLKHQIQKQRQSIMKQAQQQMIAQDRQAVEPVQAKVQMPWQLEMQQYDSNQSMNQLITFLENHQ